jgi:uncharacterized membrane protein YbhN (UPF0104 family)/O-antigen ligase
VTISRLIKIGSLLMLSVLLLWVGIRIAGADKVFDDLRRFPAWVLAATLTAFALNLAVVSFRLSRLLKYFDVNVPYSIAFKASLQGHFASLFFISLFGQVAGRQAVLRHYGTQPVFMASLTAIERIVLFVVSAVFCLLGAAWLLDGKEVAEFLGRTSFTQMVLAAILSLLASLWFGRSRFEAKLLTGMQSKQRISQLYKVAGITFVAQALVLSAFLLGAMGLNPEISFWNLLAAAAITSFAASLPISVNGWGMREVAAIFAFGHVGMSPSSALAISILVGLSSTVVVLVAWPYVFSQKQGKTDRFPSVIQTQDRLPIEKTATWGIVTATAVLIFFQIHLPLNGGVINLNLADAFAVLALATLMTHIVYTRQFPRWVVPKFNLLLLVIGVLLLLAFLHGAQIIGVTQWALAGRLLGWLVLVGYLSVGVLTISYLDRLGVWRFIETLIATAVVVVLFHAVMRWLVFSGWLDPAGITLNFEGFSGNRNALALQLLVCSVLLLAYASGKGAEDKRVNLGSLSFRRDVFLAAIHGVILAGLVFTGSRAGMLTGLILLIATAFTGFADRRMVLRSVVNGFLLWIIFAWLLPWVSQQLTENTYARFAVQSIFSNEASNLERWETIRRGFEMWRDSPWLGTGLGVFIETSAQWFKRPIVIHSTPVWILAEFGLLGAGILLAILTWILVHITRAGLAKPGNRAVIMLLGVFLIFGLVHEIFYQRIFWLVLGLCIALPFREHSRQVLTGSPNPR